jgi:hypothetical protein
MPPHFSLRPLVEEQRRTTVGRYALILEHNSGSKKKIDS